MDENPGEPVSVSVAVCVKDAEAVIEGCLRSILRNRPSEIIVVDDGSTDATVKLASKYADKILYSGCGVSYARQLAAENAGEKHIAYVDADVTLPPGTLADMLSQLTTHGYVGIRARIEAARISSYWEWAEDQHIQLFRNTEGPAEVIGTRATIFVRDAILREPFDPLFDSMEDVDLAIRLRNSGLSVGISSAPAFHRHRATAMSLLRQQSWYGRGCATLAWKHKRLRMLARVFPLPIHGPAIALLKGRPRLLPYYFVGKVAHSFGFWCGLARILLRRGSVREAAAPGRRPLNQG